MLTSILYNFPIDFLVQEDDFIVILLFYFCINIVIFVPAIVYKMGTETQIVVGRLKGHIEQIISKYELALSENASLKGQLHDVLEELEEKNSRIKDLEQKVEQMQLADVFAASSDDVKEAKKRIGKIVREIDKCISMLND